MRWDLTWGQNCEFLASKVCQVVKGGFSLAGKQQQQQLAAGEICIRFAFCANLPNWLQLDGSLFRPFSGQPLSQTNGQCKDEKKLGRDCVYNVVTAHFEPKSRASDSKHRHRWNVTSHHSFSLLWLLSLDNFWKMHRLAYRAQLHMAMGILYLIVEPVCTCRPHAEQC